MADHSGSGLVRWVSVLSLAGVGLFYLQFGLQALVHFVPQGILSLVGAITLLWGAVRRARGATASAVVLIGTIPILVLHALMTLEDRGELPFLIGSIPVPLVAAFFVGVRKASIPKRGIDDHPGPSTGSD